jgi:hypothetical protein
MRRTVPTKPPPIYILSPYWPLFHDRTKHFFAEQTLPLEGRMDSRPLMLVLDGERSQTLFLK